MNVPSVEPAKSTKVGPRATREPEELRSRILDAALRVFAARGFHGTAVPEIAVAARVGVGSIYRHFESKERLVNAVFRRSKGALRDALLLGLDLGAGPESAFRQVWARLARFQRDQPLAFQFLEMQDHVPYLDEESREVERSVLSPIWMATQALRPPGSAADVPAEVLIALVWGAFVGLTKAERLGYIALDEHTLARAGEVCLRALLLPADTTAHGSSRKPKKPPRVTPKEPSHADRPRLEPASQDRRTGAPRAEPHARRPRRA